MSQGVRRLREGRYNRCLETTEPKRIEFGPKPLFEFTGSGDCLERHPVFWTPFRTENERDLLLARIE
jgi:hypothetical protein